MCEMFRFIFRWSNKDDQMALTIQRVSVKFWNVPLTIIIIYKLLKTRR